MTLDGRDDEVCGVVPRTLHDTEADVAALCGEPGDAHSPAFPKVRSRGYRDAGDRLPRVTGVAELRVRLLGGLAVEDVPVLSLGSRKGRAVLRRLALAAGAYVAADDLVAVAWPEGAPSRAADQLAVLVSRLRGVVGSDR